MTQQHTPGPWHICRVSRQDIPQRVIRDAQGFSVGIAGKPANSRAKYIDAEANARLIAAAPEILEEICQTFIDHHMQAETGEPLEDETAAKSAERLRRLIYKATGQDVLEQYESGGPLIDGLLKRIHENPLEPVPA
jgi:hypothetical protein